MSKAPKELRIETVIGARPQFIKAAHVSRAIKKHNSSLTHKSLLMTSKARRIKETVIHTGQHYGDNMSEVFFRELDIKKPDYNLGVGSGSHGQQSGYG